MIDFFKPGFDSLFGSEVLIVGPHMNVMSVIRHIVKWKENKHHAPFIISINRAVNIPVLNSDLWMVADPNAIYEKWFDDGLSDATVSRMFSLQVVDAMPTPLDDDKIGGPSIEFTFHQGKTMSSSSFEPIVGMLRPNGTIFAQALQACYHADVRKVWIAGVAFAGNQYYDGTVWHRMPGNHWNPYIPICNNLIKHLTAKGMQIRTLTPSKLYVELEQPEIFWNSKAATKEGMWQDREKEKELMIDEPRGEKQ